MAKKIASFTPEQASALWKTHKRLLSSRILDTLNKAPVADDPGVHKVLVFNDSGEFIPPYACMQIEGTIAIGDATYVEVVKPDKTDGQYLFNTESAIGEKGMGIAFAWDVVRMLGNEDEPTIDPGDAFIPVVGEWYIEEGDGPFCIYGPDKIQKKILRGRIQAPITALVRFALLADLSTGTASATIKSMAGVPLYIRDVLDPEGIFDELETDDTGLAISQGGKYYVIQAPCGA